MNTKHGRRKKRSWMLKKKYNIPLEEYEELLSIQNYKCCICGRSKEENVLQKELAVDHCHETNIVRGLLCDYCNVGLGKFKDSEETLIKALAYLKRNKLMNKYKIEYEHTAIASVYIDALNESDAEDQAFEEFEALKLVAPMITKVVELD